MQRQHETSTYQRQPQNSLSPPPADMTYGSMWGGGGHREANNSPYNQTGFSALNSHGRVTTYSDALVAQDKSKNVS